MEQIKKSLERYVNDRIETGGFLRACLENDLVGAVARADFINSKRLDEIVRYIFNNIPSECWGSKEAVAKWLSRQ